MKSRELVILILCIITGIGLRLYAFDQKSLWIDEIHTFNESRDDLRGQLRYYRENPTHQHPPLFFVLTHLFSPFPRPERDLRVLPVLFGILSLPLFYYLARSFSPSIALPCVLALTFMTYHIHYSQEGRMYSLVLFGGAAGLCFLMKHLKTSTWKPLFITSIVYSLLILTSYSAIPFVFLSPLLLFYRVKDHPFSNPFRSLLFLNGLIFLFCLPWFLMLMMNYKGQSVIDPLIGHGTGSFFTLLGDILFDWTGSWPLAVLTVFLFILTLFLVRSRNVLLLLLMILLPIGGVYGFCRLFQISHFITSRYFIPYLPLFIIALFLSLEAVEQKWQRSRGLFHFKYLFMLFFLFSNMLMLPLYYCSEKQDFRGVASYLATQLRDGDRVFLSSSTYIAGLLHYFRVYPEGRHYDTTFRWIDSGKVFETAVSVTSQNQTWDLVHSNVCCSQFLANQNRLWILAGKEAGREIVKDSPCVLKGYFDGRFSHFRRYPSDASMVLFLWDPQATGKKGNSPPLQP